MEDWKSLLKGTSNSLLQIPGDSGYPILQNWSDGDGVSGSLGGEGTNKGSSLRKTVSLQQIRYVDEEEKSEVSEPPRVRSRVSINLTAEVLPMSGSSEIPLSKKSSLRQVSSKLSVDMSQMLNELTKPGQDLGIPSPLNMRRSKNPQKYGPYEGPPHLSLANLAAEDNFREQDAALKQANVIVAHTLLEKECTAIDVIRVWEEISKFILMKLMGGRAVRIAGLGVFTYKEHRTPVNQKTFKVIKYPLFFLANHLVSTYGLKQEDLRQSNIPEVPLNYSVIAHETHMPRSMVDGIITEILQSFARGVITKKPLELPFPGIGKLRIRNRLVTFRFYAVFCNQLGFSFNETDEKPTSEEFPKLLPIPGRMTPLRHHIPTPNFRSVFHLREVRSVHEKSVAVRVRQDEEGERYISFDEAKARAQKKKKKCQKDLQEEPTKQVEQESFLLSPSISYADFRLKKPQPTQDNEDGEFGKNLLEVERERLALKKLQMIRKNNQDFVPQPLYNPHPVETCTLNAMVQCPAVLHEYLEKFMYRAFVETLGKQQVKSHFHRRGFSGITEEELDKQRANKDDAGQNVNESRETIVQSPIVISKTSPSDSTGSDKTSLTLFESTAPPSASAQTDELFI